MGPEDKNTIETDLSNMEKPDYLDRPHWYFTTAGDGWDFYIGKVFRRVVFNIYTPWFSCGYAW